MKGNLIKISNIFNTYFQTYYIWEFLQKLKELRTKGVKGKVRSLAKQQQQTRQDPARKDLPVQISVWPPRSL